jgi:hypothetical protein
MLLLSIWKSNREAALGMTVEQVVNNAGDGHLKDANEASQEFRGYLRKGGGVKSVTEGAARSPVNECNGDSAAI